MLLIYIICLINLFILDLVFVKLYSKFKSIMKSRESVLNDLLANNFKF